MTLTRITSTVMDDVAVTSAKLGTAVVTESKIGPGAVTGDKLAANVGTTGPISANLSTLHGNVVQLTSNLGAAESNVAAIKDATTDLNIGSGKYFFDKSGTSLGIANGEPVSGTISLGTPANVIISYTEGKGGNVLIGEGLESPYNSPNRLDVRGSANTGALRATNIGVGTAPTSRPITIESGENEQIRLINTHNGGDVKIEYRNSFGTDTNWFGGLEESDGSFRINFKEDSISSGEDTYLAIKN